MEQRSGPKNETETAIHTAGLRKRFDDITAVDGIDLDVQEGEIFGLVGPDGAGKTTTMRMLSGVMDPSEGAIEVAGSDVIEETEAAKRKLGYMSQQFSLYGDLTVAENLTFFGRIYNVPTRERKEREEELLDFSRLTPFRHRLAEHLSGGMKQKLALACTLLHTPDVLLLDEPTTGVDPVSRRDFWRILYSLLSEGVTLFISTPYMDEAERCNRVALMDRGRILLCDTPQALKERMRGVLIELIANPQRKAKAVLEKLDSIQDVQVFGERLHVWLTEAEDVETLLTETLKEADVQIDSMRRMLPGLEDVFISMLSEDEYDERPAR